MCLLTVLCVVPGTSITSRKGPSTTCNFGVAGRDEEIASTGPASPPMTVTDLISPECDVEGLFGRVFCADTVPTHAAITRTQSWARARSKVIPDLLENLR